MPFTDMILLAVTIAVAQYVVPRFIDNLRAGWASQREYTIERRRRKAAEPPLQPRVRPPLSPGQRVFAWAFWGPVCVLLVAMVAGIILDRLGLIELYNARRR